jgi:hypothetical protein
VLAALAAAGAPAQPAADTQAQQRLRAHVEFLASDLLEGRGTGTRGHELAAAYVAAEFRKLGLKPGGVGGSWLVPVPLRRASHAEAPALTLTLNGRSFALVPGKDVALRPSLTERAMALSAPLMFVGSGISDRALGIDDYAGIDVRGKIAIAVDHLPASVPTDVAAHVRSTLPAMAARHGAVGFIHIGEGPHGPGQIGPLATQPVTDWVDSAGLSGRSDQTRAVIAISPEWAERLFERAPMTLAKVRAQLRTDKPVRGFALPASLTLRAKAAWNDFTSSEVVGILPGSDPRLAAEHIALMGHLDHLGLKADAKPGEDNVYNGALDNAAGVATLIEAARRFTEVGRPPRRSVMFIANTAEELGLLGASYFAAHATVPVGQIVGLINLDMPLLLYDFNDVIAFGAERSTIGRAVVAAGSGLGVAVTRDAMPEQNLFIRSDHYPFAQKGVPAVFIMTGHGNGGKDMWSRFLSSAYHDVDDDLSQPIDWRAAARFAELNYRLARTLSDADQRPLWYASDYFGETFAPGQLKAARGAQP